MSRLLALNRRFCHINISDFFGYITVVHSDDNHIVFGGEASPHYILVFGLIVISTVIDAGVIPDGLKSNDFSKEFFRFLDSWK